MENTVCREVIGRHLDDPKGRWRVGGGINVPLKIKMISKAA